jgi:hypothetical protein
VTGRCPAPAPMKTSKDKPTLSPSARARAISRFTSATIRRTSLPLVGTLGPLVEAETPETLGRAAFLAMLKAGLRQDETRRRWWQRRRTMGEMVPVVKVDTKGLAKLARTVGHGVGHVLPFLLRWHARAAGDARRIEAEAERQAAVIEARGDAEVAEERAKGEARAMVIRAQGEAAVKQLSASSFGAAVAERQNEIRAELAAAEAEYDVPVTWDDPEALPPIPDLETRADRNAHLVAVRRQANIEIISLEAARRVVEDGEPVDETPVPSEFVARFFDYAKDVSTPELQALCGAILAGEVRKGGSVPLATLDILRNLTRDDLAEFGRWCGTMDLRATSVSFDKYPFRSIFLADAGLIVDLILRGPVPEGEYRDILAYERGRIKIRRKGGPMDHLGHHAYRITVPACPIAEALKSEPHGDYFRALVASLRAEGDVVDIEGFEGMGIE